MDYKITTHNEKETLEIAQNFESEKFPNMIICLDGELGSGKTMFTKGIANGLGIEEVITSPTFTIMKKYDGSKFEIFHLDMYRFESSDEIYGCGLDEILFDISQNQLVFIEWSEKIKDVLPSNCIEINISLIEGDKRLFEIKR